MEQSSNQQEWWLAWLWKLCPVRALSTQHELEKVRLEELRLKQLEELGFGETRFDRQLELFIDVLDEPVALYEPGVWFFWVITLVFHMLLERLLFFCDFSVFPNKRRPPCTTMPWTIRPALVVLWGVCWMFHNPSIPVNSQLQSNLEVEHVLSPYLGTVI